MSKNQKGTLAILCAIGCFFLILSIFPNLHGAKNSEMLSVFEPDEYAQYPYVLHMLMPGETLFQSIHNFAVYLHYYYGYPFYFFSAIAILPIKLGFGSEWTNSTSLIVMVLRETISVLPMLIAILILVWMQTKFQSKLKSILLFLFLATIPAVVSNNTWWHPDSLLALFCVLTFFFLQRDELNFGKNFYFSAITCGFAIGSKILGVLFCTTYVVYILYGLILRKVGVWPAIKKAVVFLLLMAATIVITNPLLLLPIERSEIIAVFKSNLSESTKGFWVIGGGLDQNWKLFSSYVTQYYGGWILVAVSAILAVVGFFQSKTRLLSILISIWTITYLAYFLFFASTLRPHYFLPVLVPLASFLALPFSNSQGLNWRICKVQKWEKTNLPFVIELASISFIALLLIFNTVNGIRFYQSQIRKEETSLSIQFFDRVDEVYLSKLPNNKKFSFYRDWRAYIAPQANWTLTMSWDLINYENLKEQNPDFLFLESDNIAYFSDVSKLDIALDATAMKNKFDFYSDAKADKIDGYVLLESSKFGKVFARKDVSLEYFQ